MWRTPVDDAFEESPARESPERPNRLLATLRLRSEPHRGVSRAIAIITAAPLDDLQKETLVELFRISVEKFAAMLIAVVQDMVRAHRVQHVVRQRVTRGEVVVVIPRDAQHRQAVGDEFADRAKNIAGAERNVVQPGAMVGM